MVSQIVLWCDRCFHAAEQKYVFGEPLQLGWSKAWREVHLCSSCKLALMQTESFANVALFFEDFGEVIKAEPATAPPAATAKQLTATAGTSETRLPCLYCPAHFAGPSGIARHLRTIHSRSTPYECWGNRCPLCGQTRERLAQHAAKTHDLHVTWAFVQADRRGDEFGVVAAQRQEVLG